MDTDTNTDTYKKKTRQKKKPNILEFKTNRVHAHSCSHTNTKMMDRKAPVTIYLCLYLPIQLTGLALTLPERLDLMTYWERDRDTAVGGREGRMDGVRGVAEGESARKGEEEQIKEGKKRERGWMRGDRKSKEEAEGTRDGQLRKEKSGKSQCLVVGV